MLHDRNLLLQTDDADELAGLLAGKGMALCDVAPRAEARGPLCRIASLAGPQSYLAEIRYGRSVSMAIPALSGGYTLVLPVEGATMLETPGGTLACTGQTGGLLSPGQDAKLAMDTGATRLSLSLSRDLVEGHMERLSGQHVHGPIAFTEALDFTSRSGQVIRGAIELMLAAEGAGQNPLAHAAHRAHFEATVIGELLLHQPHSHSALLGAAPSGAVSRDVRRAVDFIEANLTSPITLADLVAVTGVPARTLNEHFRIVTGFPPIAYLHRRRLQAARDSLMANPELGVTQTATAFGFTHFGRFAGAYRRMFDETPSQTARAHLRRP